jgi:hypothetical protein
MAAPRVALKSPSVVALPKGKLSLTALQKAKEMFQTESIRNFVANSWDEH